MTEMIEKLIQDGFDIDQLDDANPMALLVLYRSTRNELLSLYATQDPQMDAQVTDGIYAGLWRLVLQQKEKVSSNAPHPDAHKDTLQRLKNLKALLFVTTRNERYHCIRWQDAIRQQELSDAEAAQIAAHIQEAQDNFTEIGKPVFALAETVLEEDEKSVFLGSFQSLLDDTDLANQFGLTVSDVKSKRNQSVEKINAQWLQQNRHG